MSSSWIRAVVASLVGFVVVLVLGVVGCSSSPSGTPGDAGLLGNEAGTNDGATGTTTPPFNVIGATSLSATRVAVTFDAPPNPAQAVLSSNYAIAGLSLAGAPMLLGNVVTLTTFAQEARAYNVRVTGVTRQSDAKALAFRDATFLGRAPFRIASAASASATTVTITFDARPHANQATRLANYAISGLTLAGTPQLAGNTVTLTTSSQVNQSYTATVGNITRESDGEPLAVGSVTFAGTPTFNIASAASAGNTKMTVTFDAPPNIVQATTLANYGTAGLTLSGTPQLSGSTVTLTTSPQAATDYLVTVANVTRASDGAPLVTSSKDFNGRTSFNVASVVSLSTTSIRVTFDAPPTTAQAMTAGNYGAVGLTLSAPQLVGNEVTLTTTTQAATPYELVVSNVTRNADAEALADPDIDFTGRAPFNVQSVSSTNSVTVSVTFDAAPNLAQATTAANYTFDNGLMVVGTPVLAVNTVTIQTTVQTAQTYNLTVANVTRASDAEALTDGSESFMGTAVQTPTVTNVVVTATNPNNGTTPYNTGTVTVQITGTELTTVDCVGATKGVRLDDLNGIDVAADTRVTACTVDSDTQITATFPNGLRTNGATGWNVIATNTAGSNVTSTVKLVPIAGLVISEVYIGTTGLADHEFVEIYNRTGTAIDTTTATGIGLRMHIRTSTGTNTHKPLTLVSTGVVPANGFVLAVSSVSALPDLWFTNRDYTYTQQLGANGSVYLSLSTTANLRVLDKVGWGTQAQFGYEATATANILADESIERKPAAAGGHATDTDDNSADFNAPSIVITPRGIADGVQP